MTDLIDVDIWLQGEGYEPAMFPQLQKELYLELITGGRMTVGQLMTIFNIPRTTIRDNLKVLIKMDWVKSYPFREEGSRKNGRPLTYYETTHIVD